VKVVGKMYKDLHKDWHHFVDYLKKYAEEDDPNVISIVKLKTLLRQIFKYTLSPE
jgi:hypothetical protein